MSTQKAASKKNQSQKNLLDKSHRLVLAIAVFIAGLMPIMVLFNLLALNISFMSNWSNLPAQQAETFVSEPSNSLVTTQQAGTVQMSREPLLLGFGTPENTQTWYPLLMLAGGALLLVAAYLLNRDRFVAKKQKASKVKSKK